MKTLLAGPIPRSLW